ncbi:MAG: aldehyde dehydrogenase family protein [Myxococcota bacterium]
MRDRRLRAHTLIRIQQNRNPHLFVGGLDVEAEGSATLVVTSPTDGTTVGRIPTANARDVDKAVISARKVQRDHWQQVGPAERARLLWRLSDALEEEANDLAIFESLQTGKTFRDVLSHDIAPSIEILRYYAGWIDKHCGEHIDLGRGQTGDVTWEGPAVVAAVLPQHDPFAAAVRKSAVALAVGASIIIKPPERAPLTVLQLAAIMNRIGFPPGSVNVLTGQTATEEAMASHPDITSMTYSGPIDQARRMLVGAAKSNLKPVHFELGGKSSAVLFEDGPITRATQAICASIFRSRCTHGAAAAHLLVHERIYENVCSAITARAREIILGDPLDEHTELGPMTDEDHLKRVLAYVELGRREGATVVAGGNRDVEGPRSMGCYVKPSVLVQTTPAMRVTREDINGPVLCISRFRHEDEVVEALNAADYGTAASLWTNDLTRGRRLARRLDVGTVWINAHDTSMPGLPQAGRRLSGLGRDLGRAALMQTALPKSILVDTR